MKFKNTKNKASSKGGSAPGGKITKSPSNSRTISEIFIKIYGLSLKIFIVLVFLLAIVIIGLDLSVNIQAKQVIDLEREELTKDLKFWENFIAKHQDYKDAYFKASILEYKLGDKAQAKIYVEKGLSLDPNSKDGRKIEELLNK